MNRRDRSRDMSGPGERFFFFYSLALFLIVAVFFPLHALVNRDHLPPIRPLLHAHAILLGGWFALVVVQTWLIGRGRAALHMKLGTASIILVLLMIPLSVRVSYDNMLRTDAPQIFYGSITNVSFFAIYYTLALIFRKAVPLHKRFMMLASLSMMMPALARVGYVFELNPFAVLPMWLALLLALPAYDLLSERRIRTANLIGLGLSIVLMGILIVIGPPPK